MGQSRTYMWTFYQFWWKFTIKSNLIQIGLIKSSSKAQLKLFGSSQLATLCAPPSPTSPSSPPSPPFQTELWLGLMIQGQGSIWQCSMFPVSDIWSSHFSPLSNPSEAITCSNQRPQYQYNIWIQRFPGSNHPMCSSKSILVSLFFTLNPRATGS